ncbi:hypothetical protein D3C73_1413830 [compost metagenome]
MRVRVRILSKNMYDLVDTNVVIVVGLYLMASFSGQSVEMQCLEDVVSLLTKEICLDRLQIDWRY